MTTRCPRCFTPLGSDERLYECRGPCETFPDPEGSAYHGAPVTIYPTQPRSRDGVRNWQPPAEVACHVCRKPATEICLICHHRLPPDWRLGKAVCVALAGARATGKSVYIGVIVNQLREMLQRMQLLLSFATPISQQVYSDVYERPLYHARKLLPPTNRMQPESANAYQATPMILKLGVINGAQRYLVFRDVAGEDLERPADDTRYLSYFRRADAVLFMFDPSAVPHVRDLLRGMIADPLMQSGNPETVLVNLLQIIGDASPPIAMVLSKFDTLQELRAHDDTTWSSIMANPGAAFQRDPGAYEPRYDPGDAELLDLEISSLLQTLGAQAFVNAMQKPPRGYPYVHQYFAVSALGGPPDGEQLHPHGIAPFRCLDPIRWVLAGAGLLDQ